MSALVAIPALGAVVCWLVAVVSWVLAIQHRKPEVSLMTLFFAGYKSFDADHFTPEGQRHQRRFLLGVVGFFLCMIGTGALATMLATS